MLKRWCSIMDFLGCSTSVKYPLWLRRTYILTWPIAAPIRIVLFMLFMLVFFIVFAVLGCFFWLAEKIIDFCDYILDQWNEKDTYK